MKTSLLAAVSTAALLLSAAGAASGQTISATITADNHYAFYVSDDSGNFTYIGGNELGSGGSPGNYNWSLPEVWNIASAPTHLYIAAWSDNRSAQGLLAEINFGDETYHSGDAAWRVYHSFNDLGDGSAHPAAGTVANWVNLADTGNAWQTPFIGGQNGSYGPWGMVPGITTDARWMWAGNPGLNDPMLTGSGYGETLVFGTAIPTPGAAAVIGLGGLLAFRRRR